MSRTFEYRGSGLTRRSSILASLPRIAQRRSANAIPGARALPGHISYFVVIIPSRHITDKERSRVFAFIPLFIASVAFWSLYQQQFGEGVHQHDADQRQQWGRVVPPRTTGTAGRPGSWSWCPLRTSAVLAGWRWPSFVQVAANIPERTMMNTG